MSIDLTVQYPGKIGPATVDYPYGEPRNITAPSDGTGTPWEAAIVKDTEGFKQALLKNAGIVPSGTPDKATDSEYLKAILSMISSQTVIYVDSGAANVYVINPDTGKQGPALLTAGLEVIFTPGNDSTGPSTIDVNGLGAVPILNGFTGLAIDGGLNKTIEIVAGESMRLTYDGANWFTDGLSGSWTPTVQGGTTAGTSWGYSTQIGNWRKIGKLLLVSFNIGVNIIGSGAVGNLEVSSIPNTPLNIMPDATNTNSMLFSTSSFNNTGGRTMMATRPLNDGILFIEFGGGVPQRSFTITDMPAVFGLTGVAMFQLK